VKYSITIRSVYCGFLVFFLCSQALLSASYNRNLFAVVIMVKDEVDVIVPTLQPFIDAGVDSFFVYDTGSTDGTQQMVGDYFKQCGINNSYIIEEPFIDFAISRNRALDLAEQFFPETTFFLMLDAEWYTYNVEQIIQFCQQNKEYIIPGLSGSCYLIRLKTIDDGIDNYTPRLFRREKNARYSGVVHEAVRQQASGILPASVYFEYKPAQIGRDKSKARLIRDYTLLKADHEKDPSNSRTIFYLAQTCQFLDQWEEAIFYYQKRAEMGEISEEKYLALYRIGCAIDHLIDHKCNDVLSKHTHWQDALYYYLAAHTMLPYRAEPLVRIAYYYLRNNQHVLAYLFANRSVDIPYPQNSILFVEKHTYDYLRYDILAQCAFYVGEFEVGKKAVLQALKVNPKATHLYNHLDVYLQRCVA
jgi:hypothetical protein